MKPSHSELALTLPQHAKCRETCAWNRGDVTQPPLQKLKSEAKESFDPISFNKVKGIPLFFFYTGGGGGACQCSSRNFDPSHSFNT